MAFGFIGKILGKVRDLPGLVYHLVSSPFYRIREKLRLPEFSLRGWVAANRKKAIAGGAAALGALIISVAIGIAIAPEQAREPSLAGLFSAGLPPEEFFLPDEPDFVPPLLLEREPRGAWTVEDAAPFWTDPLTEGRDLYEAIIRETVDGIMERVP